MLVYALAGLSRLQKGDVATDVPERNRFLSEGLARRFHAGAPGSGQRRDQPPKRRPLRSRRERRLTPEAVTMAKLRIQPHGRLQEWVAHENGYFSEEGLDYEFRFVAPDATSATASEVRTGAFELYQEGRGAKGAEASDISSACHWAVNQAAASRYGRMWGHAYSVVPGGIYVSPDSGVRRPEELASVEIAVGYHSGSHFTAIQALEVFFPPEQIRLRFVGRPYARLDAALERSVPAVSAWGTSGYVLEQHDFRKIVDTTFMVGFLFPAEVEESDIAKFMKGMERAQRDIDLAPERYKHFYEKELPERFLRDVDVRRFGVGERIVFLPYTEEMYEKTRRWMEERKLFEDDEPLVAYEDAVRGLRK